MTPTDDRMWLERIDEAEVTRVCRDLVRLCTVNPPGAEEMAASYIANYLGPVGFETQLLPMGTGRASIVARLRGQGGADGLMFNGHLDVVGVGAQQWRFDPFSGAVAEGKVWGRGSSDMKGGVAAMLVAARTLAEAKLPLRGDLIMAATADEEDAMEGAIQVAALEDLGPLHAIIISEPTANTVGLSERGVLWLEIKTHGKTAHGSMPELGHNAIMMMVALIPELEKLDIPYQPHPVLGKFTHSFNTIQGGVVPNVVPDECTLTIDMRTLPGQHHGDIMAQIEDVVAQMAERMPNFRATVRVTRDLPAADTAEDNPAVGQFKQAVQAVTGQPAVSQTVRFATEAAIFVPALGVPSIIFGPGDPSLAHQPDEYVEIDKMVAASRIYAQAAVQMLG